jgi:hypothetical protein
MGAEVLVTRRLTEAEYLRLTDPGKVALLFNSRTPLRTTTRKARLFVCACCRRVWDWLGTAENRAAVEAGERAADGEMRVKDLRPFCDATSDLHVPMQNAPRAHSNPARYAAYPFAWPCGNLGATFASWLAGCRRAGDDVSRQLTFMEVEWAAQCALIHDLLGNPFRPVAADPAWITPAVVRIAQAAYSERTLPSGELNPARLAVLSDALEEAGCGAAELLSHLRSAGPHVRGCWAVDLCLGKS